MGRPFHIFVGNFSCNKVQLPKSMEIARSAHFSSILNVVDTVACDQNTDPSIISETDIKSITSELSAFGKVTHQNSGTKVVSAENGKPPKRQETEISHHIAVQK